MSDPPSGPEHRIRITLSARDGYVAECLCGWRRVLGHLATIAETAAAARLPHPSDGDDADDRRDDAS
jgi:hypothetical protein